MSSLPSALDRVGTALASAPMVGSLLKQVTPEDFHARSEALHSAPVAQALSVIAGEDVLTKSTGTVVKALATALDFPYGAASLIGYVAEQLAAPATAVLVTDDRIRAHSLDALLIADSANCARLGVLAQCPSWWRIQEGARADSIAHQLERLAEAIRTDRRSPTDPIDIAVTSFASAEGAAPPWRDVPFPAPRASLADDLAPLDTLDEIAEPPAGTDEPVPTPRQAGPAETPDATEPRGETAPSRPSGEQSGATTGGDKVEPAALRADAADGEIVLTRTAASALAKLLTAGRWATRREYVVAGMLLEQLRQQIDTEQSP